MAKTARKRKPQTTPPTNSGAHLTFLEHIRELRKRLFWVVGFIVVASAAAYPFRQHLMDILTWPLDGRQLYYLTPIGGFSFVIKICTYAGIIVGTPVIMYHLYRYLEPLMHRKKRPVLAYTSWSVLLAGLGILFAYFISLPAALHFLMNVGIGNIQAMLTVDSYLTFVITYLIAAALLFQVPLLLMIINTITPLKPKRLMGLQRYVILGAFIIAAIISPTPDIVNQLLLAVPIIIMYQVGIIIVWLQNRRRPTLATESVEE